MDRAWTCLVVVMLFSSCGIFVQQAGLKNFKPDERISARGLNDFQYDFVYLTALVEEGFPRLDSVFPKPLREMEKSRILAALDSTRSKADFVVLASSYLSRLKNQHSSIYLRYDLKSTYPYVVFISSGEWYIYTISTAYDSSAIGKRIIGINGLTPSEVEDRLIAFTFGENRINQQYALRSNQLYSNPHYLRQAGVISWATDTLFVSLEDGTELNLRPVLIKDEVPYYRLAEKSEPVTDYRKKTYSYSVYEDLNFGYLQFNACHDSIDILEGIGSYVKTWMQPMARAYVIRQFNKQKPSRRVAGYYNKEYPVFRDMLWEMVDSLNASGIDHLIIDLRHNPGGNLTLGIQLMYFLTENDSLDDFQDFAFTSEIYKAYFVDEYRDLQRTYSDRLPDRALLQTNPGANLFTDVTDANSKYFVPSDRPVFKGKVYVLSNYRTGSAAAMLTTLLQDNRMATVVGTSVGNNPTGATIYTPMKLPRTNARISLSTSYKVRPRKELGEAQMPDIWLEYTINDLLTGRDPFLDVVMREIEKNGRNGK